MKICLIGNQNSGKTTLFNSLTGSNQKIGNWPGVTVDKKEGILKNNNDVEIIDLPGIYSLSPYSIEEKISRDYLLNEKPDLVINVIDATSFERSMYLTTQLLEMNINLVVVVNMLDILEKNKYHFDHLKLEKLINAKVIMLSALKKKGLEELINYINSQKDIKNNIDEFNYVKFDNEFEKIIFNVENKINNDNKRFIAIKALEEDKEYIDLLNDKDLEQTKAFNDDIEMYIANKRYDHIVELKKEVIFFDSTPKKTDKIDKVLLNKYLGLPIFVCIMFLIYYFSVGVIGSTTVDLVGGAFEKITEIVVNQLEVWNASDWAISLISDGIIAGISAVLGFVPQIFILFILINLLEASGYMARVTLLFDKLFKKIGLSGKSLIPFIVGAGCSVPGIMSTRILENEDERKMSILLTPFIPCSAKLPIIALFAGALFPNSYGLVSASFYFLAVIVIIVSALFLKKFKYKSQSNVFMSELPNYKVPSMSYVFRDSFDKILEFVQRAGTVIFTLSIIIWFLASFNFKFEYGVEIDKSILASIGKLFSFILYPIIGTNSWAATISCIQGLVAKEAVVSTMEVINKVAEGAGAETILGGVGLFSFFTPLSAYSFMVFNLFSAPCFGAIAAMKKEYKSKKKMLYAVLFQTGLAYLMASGIYLIGSLIGVMF